MSASATLQMCILDWAFDDAAQASECRTNKSQQARGAVNRDPRSALRVRYSMTTRDHASGAPTVNPSDQSLDAGGRLRASVRVRSGFSCEAALGAKRPHGSLVLLAGSRT